MKKKTNNKKPQQLLLVQSSPSPSLGLFLCLFHTVRFSCFFFSLLLVAVPLIWQQLAVPGRGGGALPAARPTPTGAPHLAAAAALHFPRWQLPGESCGTQLPPAPLRVSWARLWGSGLRGAQLCFLV